MCSLENRNECWLADYSFGAERSEEAGIHNPSRREYGFRTNRGACHRGRPLRAGPVGAYPE